MARNPALQPGWPPLRQMTAQEREDFEKVVSLAAGCWEAMAANSSLGERNDALELEVAQLHNLRPAVAEVSAERRRLAFGEDDQLAQEDALTQGQLAAAAAAYVLGTLFRIPEAYWQQIEPVIQPLWPKALGEYRPGYGRQDLIHACALIVAEIERLDRAEQRAEDLAHG